ncbi:MAG: alanine--glyoxylate aminotransferase family protein [Chloroflexi bacterium]|nr:alanine--glyoxylate aminotransferase family protein [Chloroflexota bacterium]
MNLRIPGPTPCPPEVLQAMTKPMINHRGPEFAQIIKRIAARLQEFFQTKNDILVLTTAGTGGMESAVVNTMSPGDKVLSASCGEFGDRFAKIAETYGAQVTRLKAELGKAVDPDSIRKALSADPSITAVLLTHNETSTGVTNDLKALAAVCKEFDKLVVVDAVSSLSSIDLQTDAWKCDVVVTGSQKGWMVPPGLAMVSVSEEGWKAVANAKMPRFYFDYQRAKSSADRGQTPWTPAVSVYFALDYALDLMAKEGMQNIFARHARIAAHTRQRVKDLGLALFADEAVASNTVTAVHVPETLQARELLRILREDFQVVMAGGQGSLDGKIFRIGHLGYVQQEDIDKAMVALEEALARLGFAQAAAV